jgi:hypothetical protein
MMVPSPSPELKTAIALKDQVTKHCRVEALEPLIGANFRILNRFRWNSFL